MELFERLVTACTYNHDGQFNVKDGSGSTSNHSQQGSCDWNRDLAQRTSLQVTLSFLFPQASCLVPVTIPQLSLKPTPEVKNTADALTKVAVLSEERKSKFLPLLVASTDHIFS